MKALKDIGQHYDTKTEVFGALTGQPIAFVGSIPGGSYHVYNDDERRELVRAVWNEACKWECTNKCSLTWEEAADNFIKEQGL